MPSFASRAAFAAIALCIPGAASAAEKNLPPNASLDQQFSATVHPFLQTYCVTCHGKEKPEAELDLSPFSTVDSVINGFAHWELVLERMEAGEMPPEKAKQHPTEAQSQQVIAWVHALRKSEAARNAGDPGPVLARRLSNAEYDYTIRDLTGVDIKPTREFPVDPANQAGFDNSGESLAMSPALVKKYLGAARTVAEHLMLEPDGFDFAPHPVVADTDRDKWGVLRIVDFYRRQPTDLADYFTAAWKHQHRAALGYPAAKLAETAAQAKISAKYLATIWAALTAPGEDVGPLAKLQSLWRDMPPPGSNGAEAAARLRAGAMRDFVVSLRSKIVPEVKNLTAPGIQNGSQTLVLWKNRRMAANRRTFDPAALQIEGATQGPANPATAGAPAVVQSTPPPPAPTATTPAIQLAQKSAATYGPNGETWTAAPAPGSVVISNPPRPQTPQDTPDMIRRGGKFLAPAITTTGSSATFKMAAAKNRGEDPDLTVPADPELRSRHEAAFARFADVFPDAFYITERARVYLDAVKERDNAGRLLSAGLHSMTGYFRDDGPLYDLILDDAGRAELDRLWQEFNFASAVPQRMHTSFVWFERTDSSYMRDPEFDPYRPEDKSVTEQARIRKLAEIYLAKAQRTKASETVQAAITEHFEIVAATILRVEQERLAAEPAHLRSMHTFAERAYRRPLTPGEREGLTRFYRQARDDNGVDHEEAMRDCIVRVLMSPHFCYRIDLVEASGGDRVAADAGATNPPRTLPLSDDALANRLSYFLWSSMPDAELRALAASGDLRKQEVLAKQARRMLQDDRVRNFATEFAGHWLDFRRFEEHNAVDRERFPAFDHTLRAAMFEEPLRFLVHLVQENRPVLDLVYGDYTFVNAPLARHYGMPAPAESDAWVRVDRAGEFGRGGLMPMAVFLTSNSPGLRTSPVKRGYWVVRRVLGERIPPPPAVVPDLPNDEKNLGDLTLRDVLAKHREDKSCASCHARFDSFGLVFEGYGPVGERRTTDFGGRPVDTRAEFPGGREGIGLPGLRDYVRLHRENDFIDNLCRKLAAYALGRTLLMSDDTLIAEMKRALAANHHRFTALVEAIVTSPQFRFKRAPAESSAAKTAALP
jgi:hypothetical protein